jgi:hypothetical protein
MTIQNVDGNGHGTIRGTIPACDWRKIMKTLARIADILAEIRTEHFPNTGHKVYRRQLANLLCESSPLMVAKCKIKITFSTFHENKIITYFLIVYLMTLC